MSFKDENWYLVKVKPHGHFAAKINLARQGFKTFLPLLNITSVNSTKYIDKKVPLFPGYMFVKFQLAKRNWQKVNNTIGVSKIINFNGKYKSLPLELMNSLKNRCDKDYIFRGISTFNENDKVSFLKGPFVNLIAKIDKMSSEERVWVLLEIMGRETRVEVSSKEFLIIA